jgi:hypothetical protein
VRPVALVFAALVAASLVTGIVGGLLRAGVPVFASPGLVSGNATLHHAALMLCGFLGTVIGIERAVALKAKAAFVAPLASGLGGLLLLGGETSLAAAAWLVAGAAFVAVNVAIVRRQAAAHTVLLVGAALAWFLGTALFLSGIRAEPVIAWWFLFVVITIAAERLELTRLARRPAFAPALLFAVLVLSATGAALSAPAPQSGGVVYGLALVALALWLGMFDVARHTLFTRGLSRYMAVCLLAGYAWLAVAGGAWSANALGVPARDVALHALGLGFIISMVMGHAPVILPAVTGLRVEFTPFFYAPLALLHVSLVLRFASEPFRAAGAVVNAAAIVLFALTLAAGALRARAARSRLVRS